MTYQSYIKNYSSYNNTMIKWTNKVRSYKIPTEEFIN